MSDKMSFFYNLALSCSAATSLLSDRSELLKAACVVTSVSDLSQLATRQRRQCLLSHRRPLNIVPSVSALSQLFTRHSAFSFFSLTASH